MEFKAKDWVLVRDDETQRWKLDIFSHVVDGVPCPYSCVGNYYSKCIPFEGNEALLGTSDAPEEKHVWHAGDHVDVLSDFDDMWHSGFIIEIDYTRNANGFYYRVESECFKSITSTGKVWCKADQLREPKEKPEEEKEWRPKRGEAVEALVNDEWQAATLILDDHTDFAPYRVRLQNGDKTWCTEEQVRPAQKEPFKFGDKVEVDFAGDWREAVIIEIDTSSIPYKVATPDGDINWCTKARIRRA